MCLLPLRAFPKARLCGPGERREADNVGALWSCPLGGKFRRKTLRNSPGGPCGQAMTVHKGAGMSKTDFTSGLGPRTGWNLDFVRVGDIGRRRFGVGMSQLVHGTRRRPRAPQQQPGEEQIRLTAPAPCPCGAGTQQLSNR